MELELVKFLYCFTARLVHQVLNSGEETEEEKTPIECRQPDFVNCVFLFSSEPKIVFPTFSPQIVAFWENGH